MFSLIFTYLLIILSKDCHEDFEYGGLCDETLKVDRETLLDDTFQQLRKRTCNMVALKVSVVFSVFWRMGSFLWDYLD